MKNNENTAVSARVQTYTFNHGELVFTVDHERVAREGLLIEGEYNETGIDSLIGISLKTLVHRTTKQPKSNGEDATDWLINELAGGSTSGRFRVTTDDKERAETAMKGYKMAPEQTERQFFDRYGVAYQDDAAWLAKHYMGVRAAMAAAAKAAKSMI